RRRVPDRTRPARRRRRGRVRACARARVRAAARAGAATPARAHAAVARRHPPRARARAASPAGQLTYGRRPPAAAANRLKEERPMSTGQRLGILGAVILLAVVGIVIASGSGGSTKAPKNASVTVDAK